MVVHCYTQQHIRVWPN